MVACVQTNIEFVVTAAGDARETGLPRLLFLSLTQYFLLLHSYSTTMDKFENIFLCMYAQCNDVLSVHAQQMSL